MPRVGDMTAQRIVGHARWRLGRIHRSLADSAQVRERRSYLLREVMPRASTAQYVMRGGRARAVLRHHTDDTGVFAEIFRAGFYALPERVTADLASLGPRARFVDLGANIGLFGVWVLTHFPEAHLTAFEPDPTSIERLRETMDINRGARAWTLVPACASNHEGTVAFAATGTSVSRMTSPGSSEATADVPLRDVFPYLERADVVKMDIEGGEWDILLDPRWSGVTARAVLMEYHPHGCPEPDARGLAVATLNDSGYVAESIVHHAAGHGMLRAIRD